MRNALTAIVYAGNHDTDWVRAVSGYIERHLPPKVPVNILIRNPHFFGEVALHTPIARIAAGIDPQDLVAVAIPQQFPQILDTYTRLGVDIITEDTLRQEALEQQRAAEAAACQSTQSGTTDESSPTSGATTEPSTPSPSTAPPEPLRRRTSKGRPLNTPGGPNPSASDESADDTE